VQAAVQFHHGASAEPQDLMVFVRDRLGPVHTPKRIHVFDSLPRSSVGKVLKNVVRDSVIKEIA